MTFAITSTDDFHPGVRMGWPVRALGLAAVLALGGATLPAFAQSQAPAQPPAPTATSADFSEGQLEAFVAAAMKVAEIRDQYTTALAEVTDEQAQQELIAEGNAEMLAAVEESEDITVEDYILIGEAAAADPELGQRIAMMVEEGMAAE